MPMCLNADVVSRRRAFWSNGSYWAGVLALLASLACERTGEASAARAQAQARKLVDMSARDVGEVRSGLPLGARELAKRWAAEDVDLIADPEAAQAALHHARNKVQDLRVAKSTFFALADTSGKVIRNDREQDLMAGAALFAAFPSLESAAKGAYVEALGVLPEAHGVKGKPDAEWVAAVGVDVAGQVKGLFVTGWAWSSYAFRLEFALRSRTTSELLGKRENMPLLYAFVLVGDQVYGAPESPEVNARAIGQLEPLSKLKNDGSFAALLEITGRQFALGVQSAPGLAQGVAIGVLRSEI
jgi:hypothetical protein